MIKKLGSQQYQGLAMPKKAITPPTPCKVGLSQILCRSLHFYFAINTHEENLYNCPIIDMLLEGIYGQEK
ncbi:hypothetical protein BJQ97_03113 [Geobacillus sp. TFV-3]|nr:hypothetical protein BJQ97_03113 [Geobacillus sp. TFV-3]